LFTIRILIIFDLMADAERKPRYWDHYWQTGQASCCDPALDETACRALAASLESDAAPAAVDRVQTEDGDFVAWLVTAGEPGS
jgi:hypothetical protein